MKGIFIGGLPGAGKTTALRTYVGEQLGITWDGDNPSNFVSVNPDDFKQILLERGYGPQLQSLAPMETCDLIHEECSRLARNLATAAAELGKNLIWDITFSSEASASERLRELRNHGYRPDSGGRISGIFIDVSVEESMGSILSRYGSETIKHINTGTGLGGRWVPPKMILDASDPDGIFLSKNRRVFQSVAGNFDDYMVFERHGIELEMVENG